MISLQLFLKDMSRLSLGLCFLPYLASDQTSPIVPDNVQMQFGKMCAAVWKTVCPGTPSQ